MTKVIKGGTVCTADRAWRADVMIEGELIKQIGEDLEGDEYIDAEGAYVIPGGIDPHTHLEMPFMVLPPQKPLNQGPGQPLQVAQQ